MLAHPPWPPEWFHKIRCKYDLLALVSAPGRRWGDGVVGGSPEPVAASSWCFGVHTPAKARWCPAQGSSPPPLNAATPTHIIHIAQADLGHRLATLGVL